MVDSCQWFHNCPKAEPKLCLVFDDLLPGAVSLYPGHDARPGQPPQSFLPNRHVAPWRVPTLLPRSHQTTSGHVMGQWPSGGSSHSRNGWDLSGVWDLVGAGCNLLVGKADTSKDVADLGTSRLEVYNCHLLAM